MGREIGTTLALRMVMALAMSAPIAAISLDAGSSVTNDTPEDCVGTPAC